MSRQIPIIDLFAGPGGLGEGFSSLKWPDGTARFDIRLSIEKDAEAIKTLTWRAFYREFTKRGEKVPEAYYRAMRQPDLKLREEAIETLLADHPYGVEAKREARQVELGSDVWPAEVVDDLIQNRLDGAKDWVLIGGPPCQAYSQAGRSRVGGIHKEDHRVYLYQEYLRIIKEHGPKVFVMENVQGLLSAMVGGEKVFDWMKRDLSMDGEYELHSFVREVKEDRDFMIEADRFGVPQMRKRVILLGLRKDVVHPGIYLEESDGVPLEAVIGELPTLRSGVGRNYLGRDKVKVTANGRPKRLYEMLEDSRESWLGIFEEGRSRLTGSALASEAERVVPSEGGLGAEFIPGRRRKLAALDEWFADGRLKGVLNHHARTHLKQDLHRYQFAALFAHSQGSYPRLKDFEAYGSDLLPDHESAGSGNFVDRFRVQLPDLPATTVTCHISKDGHYFIHYDPAQMRSLTVREAARIQTFPDNYLFRGSRTAQYHQVGNAVPPYLAHQLAQIVLEVVGG